jgi:hypothetical protein
VYANSQAPIARRHTWDKPAEVLRYGLTSTKTHFGTTATNPNLQNAFGTIHNTMKVLQNQSKGAHLNTFGRFCIYVKYINNNHLNDDQTIFPNKIFDTLLKPHIP